MTVWEIVQHALIDAGIDTYPPAAKTGDCKKPYCVLKDAGSSQIGAFSSERHFYDLMCYVPKNKYMDLQGFVQQCKEVMEKSPIYPMLIPTGVETPSFFDDSYNAHMISVQYRNNVRNTHL